jgi:AcrR family transcriptional regulator
MGLRINDKSQKRNQRERMLAYARVLFWEKGYNGTSMRDIAKAYGCRPSNIYNFFPNKEALLYEVLMDEMEHIVKPIRHLENDTSMSPIEQLRLLIENHIKLTLGYRRTSKLLSDTALGNLSRDKRNKVVRFRDTYDRILRRVIQRGIDSGDFADVDVKLAAFSIASMVIRSRIWFSPNGRLSANEFIDFIFKFVLNGLSGRGQKK